MVKFIRYLAAHPVFRQAVFMYSGILFYGGFVFLGNILIARNISVEAFGMYSLIVGIITFSALFFDFGFSHSCARVIALSDDRKEEKRLSGTVLSLFLIICFIYLIFLIVGIYGVNVVYGKEVADIYKLIIWFAFLYPFFHFFQQFFKGKEQLLKSGVYYFLQGAFFFLGVLIFLKTLSGKEASLIFYASFALATFITLLMTKANLFAISKKAIKSIRAENKRYGWHLYIGDTVERTSFHLDKLMIAFFISKDEVAYYTVGLMLVYLMTTFSMAFSQAMYKRFTSREKVHPTIVLFNWIWIGVAALLLFILSKPLIVLLFGAKYLPTLTVMPILILAGVFQSAYQPYQSFLFSKGVKDIKIGSFIIAAVNVVFNLLLIPIYGYVGAAIATFMSYFGWFIFFRWLYFKKIGQK